jgi:hypothetical protein
MFFFFLREELLGTRVFITNQSIWSTLLSFPVPGFGFIAQQIPFPILCCLRRPTNTGSGRMRNRCGPIHISIPHMEDLARLMPDAMRQVNCVGGVKDFRAFRDRRSTMLDLSQHKQATNYC